MDSLILDSTLRLVAAMVLGGVVGIEREYRSKDAGFRTHFLVALGAALFTIISQYGFMDGVKDTSRVAAQVVSGIGFIGAGLIVFQKNMVRGLTTAAGLWVTAAIGMACGVGMYAIAAIVTALILIGLEVINIFVPQMSTTMLQVSFTTPSRDSAKHAMEQIRKDCLEVRSYELHDKHTAHGDLFEVKMEVRTMGARHNNLIMSHISELGDVTMVSVE